MRHALRAACAALPLLLAALPAAAQRFEAGPAPAAEKPQGYLTGEELQFRQLMPAPPAEGSLADDLDLADIRRLQETASPERFKMAQADAESLYPRFSEALGLPLDREHLPHVVALLNRAEADVVAPTRAGKAWFARLRPYRRLRLKRVCGDVMSQPPGTNPDDRRSYPSGHSAVGWTTAYVLVRVAPDRAPQLLERAYDYGLSRLICGMHFPSDVNASRATAAALLARLDVTPAFQRDLACARAEYQARKAGDPAEPAVCRPPAPAG